MIVNGEISRGNGNASVVVDWIIDFDVEVIDYGKHKSRKSKNIQT